VRCAYISRYRRDVPTYLFRYLIFFELTTRYSGQTPIAFGKWKVNRLYCTRNSHCSLGTTAELASILLYNFNLYAFRIGFIVWARMRRPWLCVCMCVCVQSSTETTVSNIVIIIIIIIIIIIFIYLLLCTYHLVVVVNRDIQCTCFPRDERPVTTLDRYASALRCIHLTNNIARLPSIMVLVLVLFNSRNISRHDTSSSVCAQATDGWTVNKSLVNNRPPNKKIALHCR